MRLTAKQRDMLVRANARSLPGDGIRVVGPGDFAAAYALRRMGLIRLGILEVHGRAYVTEAGRSELEREQAAREMADDASGASGEDGEP